MSVLYKPNSLGIVFIILNLRPLTAEKCANPQYLTPSKHDAIVKLQTLTQMKITCWSDDSQVQKLFYANNVFKCANENKTVTLTRNLRTLFTSYLNYTQDGISLTVTPSCVPGSLQYKYDGYALKNGKVYYYQDEKLLYGTGVYIYVLSTDPLVKYAIFRSGPTYDAYMGLRLMPEQELDDELNITFWRTDVENVTIYYTLPTEKRYLPHSFQLFTKLQNLSTGFPYSYLSLSGPLVLPLHYLYIHMRYACFLQLIEDSQYQTSSDYEILFYFMFIILFVRLLNVFVNYFTLKTFKSFKWYTLRWLSNGFTLRYVVDSLRSENETQYEQMYLVIENLKAQEKNIFIVKTDTTYGYDYARVSKHFLRSMRIYENLPSSSNSDPLLTNVDCCQENDCE